MMNSDYWYGAKVYHFIFGYGRVIGYRARYKQAQVKFEDITLWIEVEDLERVQSLDADRHTSESMKKLINLSPARAIKIIEALRLGVVPESEIEEFTFHRQKEIEQIEKCFEQVEKEGNSSAIIVGEYGTGKSHFLDFISSKALKKGFVVAKAEMDIYEVRPHRPKRLYAALMENIKWGSDGSINQLREFIKLAINDHIATKVLKEHRFFKPILETFINKANADLDLLCDFLEGKDGLRVDIIRKHYSNYKLQALYDSAYAADLYCYILTGLSNLARALGFKGLIILIDEAESMNNIEFSEREKADNLIKGLLFACTNKDYRDKELFHSTMRRYAFPYCFAFPSYLFVILAMTPRFEDYDEPDWYTKVQKIELSSIDESDMQDIYESIVQVYKIAYPNFQLERMDDLKSTLFEIWMDFTTERIEFRQALKCIIEALDIKRHFPAKKLLIERRYAKNFWL